MLLLAESEQLSAVVSEQQHLNSGAMNSGCVHEHWYTEFH